MTALDSLIRLHRWQLDEQRRAVNELEQLCLKLRTDLQRLEAEQAAEEKAAQQSTEIVYGYGSYAMALVARKSKLAKSLIEAEARIAQARDALAEAFQEAKRYEIAAAKRVLHQRMTEKRLEQADMDELAIEIHQRANRTRDI
jgi:flagellar protein FliJ